MDLSPRWQLKFNNVNRRKSMEVSLNKVRADFEPNWSICLYQPYCLQLFQHRSCTKILRCWIPLQHRQLKYYHSLNQNHNCCPIPQYCHEQIRFVRFIPFVAIPVLQKFPWFHLYPFLVLCEIVDRWQIYRVLLDSTTKFRLPELGTLSSEKMKWGGPIQKKKNYVREDVVRWSSSGYRLLAWMNERRSKEIEGKILHTEFCFGVCESKVNWGCNQNKQKTIKYNFFILFLV